MFFLLYGEDNFRSKRKLAKMRAKFKDTRDQSGLNEVVLKYGENSIDEVMEAVYSSPFLAERKMIILEGYLKANQELQNKLSEIITNKTDSSIMIFWQAEGQTVFKGSELFGILKNSKFTEEYNPLSGAELESYLAEECGLLDLQIELRACRALTEAVGSDTWLLHQELAKLCAYAKSLGEDMITAEMVAEMVPDGREESVFEFLDSCIQGKMNKAIYLLENLIDTGTNELQLLSMLQKQVKTLVGARDLLDRGVTDKNEAGRILGVHPYPASKALSMASAMKHHDIAKMMDNLIEIEQRAKTGQGKLKVEIGLFAVGVK